MEISHILSHDRGESVLLVRGLGRVYAEAGEATLATRVRLPSDRGKNSPRTIRGLPKAFLRAGWMTSAVSAVLPCGFERRQ